MGFRIIRKLRDPASDSGRIVEPEILCWNMMHLVSRTDMWIESRLAR